MFARQRGGEVLKSQWWPLKDMPAPATQKKKIAVSVSVYLHHTQCTDQGVLWMHAIGGTHALRRASGAYPAISIHER